LLPFAYVLTIITDGRAEIKRFILTTPFIMVSTSIAFDTTLPALVRVCYSALEDFSGEHPTCWPGYEAIAGKVGCSARWIPELLKRLVKAGLLLIQHRPGKTNIYTLLGRVARQKTVPAPAPSSPVPPKLGNYEQKPTTKTNRDRAYRRLNANKKGPVVFEKYLPGGKYQAAVIS
jgi:hypothetical protein